MTFFADAIISSCY